MQYKFFHIILVSLILASCSSTSEQTELSCSATNQITCESLSSVYERTANKVVAQEKSTLTTLETPSYDNWPEVKSPRFLKIWFAPWLDDEGDLHGQQFMYLLLEGSSWVGVDSFTEEEKLLK